jgi:hypothetical protein
MTFERGAAPFEESISQYTGLLSSQMLVGAQSDPNQPATTVGFADLGSTSI